MFDNIGGKIKGMSKALTCLGLFFSIICSIQMFQSRHTQAIGAVVLIVGSLLSWLGSLTLYGFGELIETAASINQKLSSTENAIKAIKPVVHVPQANVPPAQLLKQTQEEPLKQIEKGKPRLEKETLEVCAKRREQALRSSGSDPRISYWVRNLDQWLKEGTITPEEYIQKLEQLNQ